MGEPVIEATVVLGIMGGHSRPLKVKCDDGLVYVVKYATAAEPRLEINEAVGTALAQKVAVPVPPGQWVRLPDILVRGLARNFPGLTPPAAGVHFASRSVPGAVNAPSVMRLRKAGGCLPRIIALDHWLDNWDRGDRPENILFSEEGDRVEVFCIDWGHILGGPNWTLSSLRTTAEHEEVYWGKLYAKFARNIRDPGELTDVGHELEATEDRVIMELVDRVQAQFGFGPADRDALVDCLIRRRGLIVPLVRKCMTWVLHARGVVM